jgi:hypothetical protein
MKIRAVFFLAATLCVTYVAPAFAQNVNPRAEAELQNWMARDPRLQADPHLMENPEYLRNHPNFATWLSQHPNARRQITLMGDYDNHRVWHDRDWWHQNNPNWLYEHHPEWAYNNPAWRGEGDWDEHHMWHDRGWWAANNSAWVAQHHPDWAAVHAEEHHEAVVAHHENVVAHHEAEVAHHEAVVQHHEMEHHEHEMERHDHH